MSFDFERVSDILACPLCKADLVHDGSALVCVDPAFRLSYPILDDIPRLLADEAVELSMDDWSQIMLRHNRNPETGTLIEQP